MAKYRCKVCGYIHEGDKAPDVCPVCSAPASEFELVKEEGAAGKKKGLDRDSNAYTIIYASVMVVLVAVVLAFTSQSLRTYQQKNEQNDKRQQILRSINVTVSANEAEAKYMSDFLNSGSFDDLLGDEAYAAFKKLDIGDIIGCKGEVFRTKMGEISVRVSELTLLSKSLLPLPEKFHGLTDREARYRQRYVDLIVNPDVKQTFIKRSAILRELRSYLDGKGFLEVETPILTPFEIGASARPFLTHHNTLNMDMVLRIETELYLKRLIVGGMDRVYEVGRIFRNEGMDPKHNPEFTTIELYQAYTDYHGMMDLVEEMMKTVAQKVCGTLQITYQGKEIDLSHWERMTMTEAVKKYSGVDFDTVQSDEEAIALAKEHHVELPEIPIKGSILAEFFDAFVEENLIQPTFIYDYPVEVSPLAKRKPSNPAITERFEYFINATEFGNAFSELNDPIDQKGRFERQVAERKQIDPDSKAQVDYDYVTALEYGLPPTGGLGFGVDRLVMLLTDSASIRDVLLFPTMKPIDQ